MNDTQLHLRWHSHSVTFTGMLCELHSGRSYTDVSLLCDGGIVRAHRAVLSLCSPYLANILSACSENDEAPLLLPEIPVQDVRYLISFIYRGQVDVPQQHIASFLNTGKHLHVLGLEQGDQLVDSPYKSETGSGSPSENEDDSGTLRGIGGNNNNIEKLERGTIQSKAVNGASSFLWGGGNIKIEDSPSDIKTEDTSQESERLEKNEPYEEGKIDLNFYLQQAIQSASMPCPLCKKEFKSQSGLRDHIRLHTGERPFVCDFCHMNFARASHLKRHRRMHTGEKPFECSVCGKDFSRGDKLKDHLRRHEAEDKLQQIRKQIHGPDENFESDSPVSRTSPIAIPISTVTAFSNISQNLPLTSISSLVGMSPLTSMSSLTSLSSISNMSHIPNLAHITNMSNISNMSAATNMNNPNQIMSNKINSTTTKDNLPPAKRQCLIPKVPLLSMAHMPQNMGHMPSHLGSQSENVGPQMMGVTSIGECILRPIN